MKKLLTLIAFIPGFVFAQSSEFGLHAGISSNSNPNGNMTYKGNTATYNYNVSASALYNFYSVVQIGVEVRALELSRKSDDSVYLSPWKLPIGKDDKKIVYSKAAVSTCALFNLRYAWANNNIYLGGAGGYAFARNNSKKLNSGENYKAPDGGRGFCYGFQAGITAGINKNWSINLEGMYRGYSFDYVDAEAPVIRPVEVLDYKISNYGFTFGLRYRIVSARSEEDGKKQ